jgi:hypothetical protein
MRLRDSEMFVFLFILTVLLLPVAHTARAVPLYAADFDANGALDSGDVNLLTAEIAAETNDPSFDLNDDGLVDTLDLDDWFSAYSDFSSVPLSTALVDVNFDTTNTVADFQIIQVNLLITTTNFTDGNLNADHWVDSLDRDLYIARGGVVPEPSTLLLAAIGVLGLTGYARVRNR